MTENCRRNVPWFIASKPNGKTLCVVGGSPSLKHNLGKLAEKRRLNADIMTTNGSLKFLCEKGLKPKFHAQFDARIESADFVENGPDIHYLIGSMSNPKVLDNLEGKKVSLWHGGFDMEEMRKILKPYEYKPYWIIGGAYTIGLRAMSLGYQMGYRKFILFGLDSSFLNSEHHAYEQKLNDTDKPIQASYQGKTYLCAPWMYRQAMNFEDNYRELTKLGCKIQVIGEGLIPDICSYLNSKNNVV